MTVTPEHRRTPAPTLSLAPSHFPTGAAMGLLSTLFGSNEKTGSEDHANASGMQAAYNPRLIATLVDDHKRLFKLFTSVSDAFASNDFDTTVILLRQFRSEIQAHLLIENVQFYVYLERSLARDGTSFAACQEMDAIGDNVLAFLKKYDKLGHRPALQKNFAVDLHRVGQTLTRRIQYEENTLFTLYQPY
jgi:hypothetical protein